MKKLSPISKKISLKFCINGEREDDYPSPETILDDPFGDVVEMKSHRVQPASRIFANKNSGFSLLKDQRRCKVCISCCSIPLGSETHQL